MNFNRNIAVALTRGPYSEVAVAIILTEMQFRGPLFRSAEILYAAYEILIRRREPVVTIGLAQVSFEYWRAAYGSNLMTMFAAAFSPRAHHDICCAYLATHPTANIQAQLIAYNGKPSRIYVETF